MKRICFDKKIKASFTVESSFVMIASLFVIFLVIVSALTFGNRASKFASEKIAIEERVSDEMTERDEEEIYVRAPKFLYGNRIIKDFIK